MWHIKQLMDNSPEMPLNTSVINRFSANHDLEQQAISGLMEGYIVSSRYHQAKMLTMVNVWTQYLGFLTGMILAFIGSIFILGKIKEDVSTIDMKEVVKFTVTSSSPGIILAFFGTLLMILTINVKHELNIKDSAIYFKPDIKVNLEGQRNQDPPPAWNSAPAKGTTSPKGSMNQSQQKFEDSLQNIQNKYANPK
jgi:hypothetical protein